MPIDPNLPPSDAAVALRSLDRRYRAAFAGQEDDEAPDDLAHRPGPDGWSALAHVVAAARGIATCAGALTEVLSEESPRLEPAAIDPDRKPADPAPTGTVDERISELAWEADALADLVDRTKGTRWARVGVVAGQQRTIGADDIVRAAVAVGVEHLRGAEQVLEAVRAERDDG
jgi:hypothetical protein